MAASTSDGDPWGDWDEAFWADVVQHTDVIISTTTPNPNPNPNPPSSNFSPPRELSLSQHQCQIPNTTTAPPVPIQVDDDDEDNDQPQCPIISSPHTLPRNAINHLNSKHHLQLNGGSSSIPKPASPDTPLPVSNKRPIQSVLLRDTTPHPKSTKTVGIQTNPDDGYSCSHTNVSQNDGLLFNSLASIWSLSTTQAPQTSLLSKLFLTCPADFYALFRCMGMSMPSTFQSSSLPANLLNLHQHVQSAGALKVAHLYNILVKINNEMTQLNVLVDALLDLCTLDNAVVLHGSLRILRAVLQLVLGSDAPSHPRGNVSIQGMPPDRNNSGIYKSPNMHNRVQFGATSCRLDSFDVDMLCNNKDGGSNSVPFLSAIDLLSLFETIHKISVKTKEESIQVEAISTMNLILMRTNPLLEREKFGSSLLFESLSGLLHKNVCLQAQKQAAHLLFLLLNCPNILSLFCSGCKDSAGSGIAPDSTEEASTSQEFSSILEGLAECVKHRGHGTQELKLRRLSVKVLAFVASSGKSGFEVFLNSKVLKGCNFLELIMQALASEMDDEAVESMVPSETVRERTLLIRESLILLNRLASGPAYSGAVLQVLTSSRDMVSLTIDVVNKMSKKGTDLWKSDSSGKRKAEDEVLDLARALRSRVFAYLGNTPS